MSLYSLARKLNAKRKAYIKKHDRADLSPVRRIEFVRPVAGERLVAMTFDDGPMAKPPSHGEETRGLTEVLLDTLAAYGARATFDVIGTTAENYPDEAGRPGDFTWSGVGYDHYPCFGEDALACAFNQPALIARILSEEHEISNHGGTHRLFGPMRAVYGTRRHMQTLGEAVADLTRLHDYLRDEFGYTMKLARPPHYIDGIPDGSTSYDAYRVMGYNYMAASFDGGGWIAEGSYEKEVDAMVRAVRDALEADEDFFNGRIIFQKDGCNMCLRTPVADALGPQLELLTKAGYRVVPVSELIEASPFEDMDPAAPEAESAKYLLSRGHAVGARNNSFYGDKPVTAAEFLVMLAAPETLRFAAHADFAALAAAAARDPDAPKLTGGILGDELLSFARDWGVSAETDAFRGKSAVLKKDAVMLAAAIVRKRG